MDSPNFDSPTFFSLYILDARNDTLEAFSRKIPGLDDSRPRLTFTSLSLDLDLVAAT